MKPIKRKSERYQGFTLRRVSRTGRPDRWQVEAWEGGRLCRWTFATKAQAQGHAERRRTELTAIGLQADQLNAEQRADAVKALKLLDGAATLTAAAECWLRYYRPPDGTLTFGALVDTYLADAAARNLRPRSLTDLRARLSRLVKDLGKVPCVSIDTITLEHWLDSQRVSHANRRNFRTVIHGLFAWAKDRHYTQDNPAADLRRVRVETGMPGIFTPAQVETIFATAEQKATRLLPYLALAFFAGIRPAEADALTWGDIDLAAGTVTVRPEVAKKRRSRIIRLADNALRWLLAYRPKDSEAGTRLVPSYMTKRRLLRLVKIETKLGAWPADVARHCFGTYHLALHGDISRTCLDMGHTGPDVLFQHYRNLATKEHAASFFGIAPAPASCVIPFKSAG